MDSVHCLGAYAAHTQTTHVKNKMAPHESTWNVLLLVLLLCTSCMLHCAARSYDDTRRSASGDDGDGSVMEVLPMHGPSADNHDLPQDLGKPYPGKSFGPMGPIDRTFLDDSLRNLESGDDGGVNGRDPAADGNAANGNSNGVIGHQKRTEYKVFSVEFHRVETPFIIGIWIFFASLAKIGKFTFTARCLCCIITHKFILYFTIITVIITHRSQDSRGLKHLKFNRAHDGCY